MRAVFCRAFLVPSAVLVAASAAASFGSTTPLTMSPDQNPVPVGAELTITFSPKVQGPGDALTFDFGDNQSKDVVYTTYCGLFGGCGTVTHVYTRMGTFRILASGTAGGQPVAGALEIRVTTGKDLYVLAAAHARGANETVWRSDVVIHNYGPSKAVVDIALLERDTDNTAPAQREREIAPGGSLLLADVLDGLFASTGTAALRITPNLGTVMATSRTYNAGAAGTYGQYVPAELLDRGIATGQVARLLQLFHDPSLAAGFRTNLGLLNPTPLELDIEMTFHDQVGATLGTLTLKMKPYEYKQLDRIFEAVTTAVVDNGSIRARTTTLDGVFFAYASVVDNLTGDPTLIPALVP